MSNKLHSVEQYNIDKCDDVFDGNRFQLILAAGIRAHEIAKTRLIASRNVIEQTVHKNLPAVQALLDVEAGKYGKEYLEKVGKSTTK